MRGVRGPLTKTMIGRFVLPLGLIGVAALASFPAREVVVGTLGIVYQQGEVDTDEIRDTDLADIFNVSSKRRKGVRFAHEMLRQHRKPIVDKIAYWSGVQRPIIKRLVEAICKRVEDLGLRVDVRRESEYLTEFTVYTTALSMNYLIRGKFIHP